jgi:uncharacterized protein YqfA (UPF0365 family)
MEGSRRYLEIDLPCPRILPRRLIEVTVDADKAGGDESSPHLEAHFF